MPKKKKVPVPIANGHVGIRMYNVGFGDCFLLTFPAPDRARKVLIDCGVHFQGRNPDPKFDEVVKRVIDDVKENDVPTIDLVIATHRHQDHVSGFENQIWKDVDVKEVWMPWTEDYTNPKAQEILLKQGKKAKKLQAVLTAMIDNPGRFGFDNKKVEEVKQIKEFSKNSLTNPVAMDMLHSGFKGGETIPRSYMPFKDRKLNTIKPAILPGVTVFAMGPSFDPEVIRDMDPPTDEQWFKMMEDTGDGNFIPILPFHRDWSREAALADPGDKRLPAKDKRAIENVSGGDEFAIAKKLEDSVNGTSLMLMFHIGNAYLFFPGDAQNGTWQSALKDDEWRDLLTRTNFYKIGHHGSHNATPKEFVNKVLKPESKAMVSLFPVKIFPQIPKKELFDALVKLPVEYVRSDMAAPAGDPPGFVRPNKFYVETQIAI